jgi:Uma2 family endonuclease
MTAIIIPLEFAPLTMRSDPQEIIPNEQADEQFFELCQVNRDLRIERNASGEIIFMPPTGAETGNRNFKVIQQLANWTDIDGTGIGFDSSTGFTLPNGAKRSPDASWIKLSRWQCLSLDQQAKFAPTCPDFVVELRSASDRLSDLQAKMAEYMQNGSILGWLIDRTDKKVYVYRPQSELECLDNPNMIDASPELNGFILDLGKIW